MHDHDLGLLIHYALMHRAAKMCLGGANTQTFFQDCLDRAAHHDRVEAASCISDDTQPLWWGCLLIQAAEVAGFGKR